MPNGRNYQYSGPVNRQGTLATHFSNSARSRVSKVLSQPTSTRIFIPPSSSNIDCEAFEGDDCAPRRGVKVNMLPYLLDTDQPSVSRTRLKKCAQAGRELRQRKGST